MRAINLQVLEAPLSVQCSDALGMAEHVAFGKSLWKGEFEVADGEVPLLIRPLEAYQKALPARPNVWCYGGRETE